MLLEGSCHCRAATFTAESHTPEPFMLCYCSLCRKVGGGGGYAINIMAEAATLALGDPDAVADYRVRRHEGDPDKLDTAHRFFCRHCGTMLWAANELYPDWIYPFASAIDTPLPQPRERVHMMLDFKAPWAAVPEGPGEARFDRYPSESIADWHRRRGLDVE